MKMIVLRAATLVFLAWVNVACNPGADPKMVAEVNRALSLALHQPVPGEIIGVERTFGGSAIRIRSKVTGEAMLREQADGACRSKLTRLINIGGAVLFAGEDATGRRIAEISVGKDYCARVPNMQRSALLSRVRTATIFLIPRWYSSRSLSEKVVRESPWVKTEMLDERLAQSLLKWLTRDNFVAPLDDNPLFEVRLVIDFTLEDGSVESYQANGRMLLEVKSGGVREIGDDFWFHLGPSVIEPSAKAETIPLW